MARERPAVAWCAALALCVLLGGCVSSGLEMAEEGRVVRYAGNPGETALTTLKALTEVQTRSTQYGEFVASIGGVTAGTDEFWVFLVNGEMVREGAGTWKSGDADVVEWYLRALPGK